MSIDTFMTAAKEYDILTNEEEYRLAEQMAGPDPVAAARAKETLITANLRFVMQMAHGYAKSSTTPLEEFVAVGLEAMVKKAGEFQPNIGKFITFVKPWIAKAFQEMHYDSMVAVPRNRHIQIKKIKRISDELVNELGPFADITDEMIAERSGFAVEVVKECLTVQDTYLSFTPSLNSTFGDDENGAMLLDLVANDLHAKDAFEAIETSLSGFSGDADGLDEEGFSAEVNAALVTLSSFERTVVVMNSGIDGVETSSKDIAERLGVQTAEVTRALKSAKAKLLPALAAKMEPTPTPLPFLSPLERDMVLAARGAEGFEGVSPKMVANDHGVDVATAIAALESAKEQIAERKEAAAAAKKEAAKKTPKKKATAARKTASLSA